MKTRILIIAVVLITGTTIAAFGHGAATGIVKERMDGMMAMGKALTGVGDMFKGKAPFDSQKVSVAAQIVREHASSIDKLFPDTQASRTGKGTEALPLVWDDWERFLTIATELEKRASELETAAAGGDKRAVRIVFAKVSKSRAACHTDFRKPKK